MHYNDNHKLSDLIATKQSGNKVKIKSSSKKKFHFKNTYKVNEMVDTTNVEKNSNSVSTVLTYLIELISNGSCVVDYIDSKTKFTEDMVQVDSSKLTDIFIVPSFKLTSQKVDHAHIQFLFQQKL